MTDPETMTPETIPTAEEYSEQLQALELALVAKTDAERFPIDGVPERAQTRHYAALVLALLPAEAIGPRAIYDAAADARELTRTVYEDAELAAACVALFAELNTGLPTLAAEFPILWDAAETVKGNGAAVALLEVADAIRKESREWPIPARQYLAAVLDVDYLDAVLAAD